MSIEAAKASVDNMVSDSDYPRSANSDELEAILNRLDYSLLQ